MPVTLTNLATPVTSNRLWTEALVPRNTGGWNHISQSYIYPTAAPAEWVVTHLEDGSSQRYFDDPYTAGTRGKYIASSNFHDKRHQLRASNGRVFFPAVSCWWWYYDPTTEQVVDMGRAPGTADTSFYSGVFSQDGTKLYFGSIGISTTTPQWLPCVVEIDVATTPPTATFLCRVGDGDNHTQNAYAYDLWVDGDYLYVLVGQEAWDVVAVHIPTKTQTVLATATVNAWALFEEIPGKGLTVKLYNNYEGGGVGDLDQFWVYNGVRYDYTEGVDPPFATHDVALYSNPTVDAPEIDTSTYPEAIGWRPAGSADDYTRINLNLTYSSAVRLESLMVLPDGTLYGDAEQYQGFFRSNADRTSFEAYGPFVAVSETDPRTIANGKVYYSGYPNGPLWEYDPDATWVGGTNPRKLGNYSNGVTFSGIKRAKQITYSSVYNRMYMVGLRARSGSGGGIGYYDFGAGAFGGTFANLSHYVEHLGLAVFDDLDIIAMSGGVGVDTATGEAAPASAQIILYDHTLTEIARYTPIESLQDTGKLFRTSESNVVVGVSPNGRLLYRWNVETHALLSQHDVSEIGAPTSTVFVQDGNTLYLMIGATLCSVDLLTLSVTVLGDTEALTTLTKAGDNLYATVDTDVFLVDTGTSPSQGGSGDEGNEGSGSGDDDMSVEVPRSSLTPDELRKLGHFQSELATALDTALGTIGEDLATLDGEVTPADVSVSNGEEVDITACQPVYMTGSGIVALARADNLTTAEVLGVVSEESIPAGALGLVRLTTFLEATPLQWDAVCGTSGGLSPGSYYFLSDTTAGKLTATPPTTTGHVVVAVLFALSTTKAKILPANPVLL